MTNKKKAALVILAACGVLIVVLVLVWRNRNDDRSVMRTVRPHYGAIQSIISTSGTVLPQNRLEIKPTINGRMERVLVSEGDLVRKGQVLGWMSSTERAALIDAARTQGSGSIRYWEEVYKQISIVAPIGGTVIVRSIEPGQSVITTVPIMVLSDRLIVKADADETDIGKVRDGQGVIISLDAYPDVRVKGRVGLISYESKIINNVTMYEVNVIPETVPDVFRSGMSADIAIIEKEKERALLVPAAAVMYEGGKHYVWTVGKPGDRPVKKRVKVGISDDRNVEVLSGITEKDILAIREMEGIPLDVKQGGNPFMPTRKTGSH